MSFDRNRQRPMAALALCREQGISSDNEVERGTPGRGPSGDARGDLAAMMKSVPAAVQCIANGKPDGAERQANPSTDEHQSADCEFGRPRSALMCFERAARRDTPSRQRKEQGEPDVSPDVERPMDAEDGGTRKAQS